MLPVMRPQPKRIPLLILFFSRVGSTRSTKKKEASQANSEEQRRGTASFPSRPSPRFGLAPLQLFCQRFVAQIDLKRQRGSCGRFRDSQGLPVDGLGHRHRCRPRNQLEVAVICRLMPSNCQVLLNIEPASRLAARQWSAEFRGWPAPPLDFTGR